MSLTHSLAACLSALCTFFVFASPVCSVHYCLHWNVHSVCVCLCVSMKKRHSTQWFIIFPSALLHYCYSPVTTNGTLVKHTDSTHFDWDIATAAVAAFPILPLSFENLKIHSLLLFTLFDTFAKPPILTLLNWLMLTQTIPTSNGDKTFTIKLNKWMSLDLFSKMFWILEP